MSFVIEKETDGICEKCGKVAETRPYGENGENVCFQCMIKNENQAKEIFKSRINSGDKTLLS